MEDYFYNRPKDTRNDTAPNSVAVCCWKLGGDSVQKKRISLAKKR